MGLYQAKRRKSQEQNINIRLSRFQAKDTEYGKRELFYNGVSS